MSAIEYARGRRQVIDRLDSIRECAVENGWDVQIVEFDAGSGLGHGHELLAARTDRHPDSATGFEFGFGCSIAVDKRTGRANVLGFDGKPNARVVVMLMDGSGRFWHGPLRAYRDALADPVTWCGLASPEGEST